MKIYLYGEIEDNLISNLLKEIDEIDEDEKLEIYINSIGGDAYSSLAFYYNLKSRNIEIDTYIDGCCYSGAALIYLLGKNRYINKISSFMIHYPVISIDQDFIKFKNKFKNIEKLSNNIKDIYYKEIKIDKLELERLMENEIYLDSKELLKLNIATNLLKNNSKNIKIIG